MAKKPATHFNPKGIESSFHSTQNVEEPDFDCGIDIPMSGVAQFHPSVAKHDEIKVALHWWFLDCAGLCAWCGVSTLPCMGRVSSSSCRNVPPTVAAWI
jgi:hypothetical protein